jgi:hypothetical protein
MHIHAVKQSNEAFSAVGLHAVILYLYHRSQQC